MTNSNFSLLTFDSLKGLVTQTNEILTPPNSLSDCKNVIATREGKIEARPGLPTIWNLPAPYGNNPQFSPNSIFYIPSSDNSFIFTYQNTSNTDDIGQFADQVNYIFNSTFYILSGIIYNDFTSYPYLKSIFTWGPQFPINSFTFSYTSSIFNNIYLNSANGLFRTINSVVTNITPTNYNQFKKINVPLIKFFKPELSLSSSLTDDNRWLKSGYKVDLIAVCNEQINVSQVLEGIPTRTYQILNIGTTGAITINLSISNINLNLDQGFIEIYRTLQYDPTKAPPTLYYKCYESNLANGSISLDLIEFNDIILTLNDDTIQFNNEQLYTSLSQLGPANVNCTIPVSDEFTLHQDYAVYSNLMRPPFASLIFTGLPKNGIDSLKIGATDVILKYTDNSIIPPANNGIIDLVTGTYRNVSDNGGAHYNLLIKSIPPDATGMANDYTVPFYAVASIIALTDSTKSVNDITITPSPTKIFDISKFPETGGIVAIVANVQVTSLFSYKTYEADPTNGKWIFKSCTAAGVEFSQWAYTGDVALFLLDASTFTALPVYATAVSTTPAGGGFSLLPNFELYPTRPFSDIPVGRCVDFYSSSNVLPEVLADIEFFGIYTQTASQQLDEVARNFSDGYNFARNPEDPYISYNPQELGYISIISQYAGYNPLSTYSTNNNYTSGSGFYDQIKASVSISAEVTFDKLLTTIPVNIMEESPQVINGITFSKLGRPEACSLNQVLNPVLIGSSLNAVIKTLSIYNKLFVFKEREGTYKIIMDEGSELPTVSSRQLVDNTAWLLLDNSVQAWEDGAIFFSNRGFCYINGNGDVEPISVEIEKEALDAYQNIKQSNLVNRVSSFLVADTRIYGCYFPNSNPDGTGFFYIFNMFKKEWTRWDTEVLSITVKSNGQITFFYPVLQYGSGFSYQDNYTLENIPVKYSQRTFCQLRQSPLYQNLSSQIDEKIPLNQSNIILSNNTYIISQTGNTSVYQNLYNYFVTMKGKDIYYNSASSGIFTLVISGSSPPNSVTLSSKKSNFILPTPNNVLDFILGGVNSEIYFNKFYPVQPRGASLSHFSEFQGLITEGISLTDVKFLFFNQGINQNVIIDNLGNFVIDDEDNLVVTSLPSFFDYENIFELPNVSSYFRINVPLSCARGRYFEYSLKHSTPYEIFMLTSLTFKYKNINSIRSKISSGG